MNDLGVSFACAQANCAVVDGVQASSSPSSPFTVCKFDSAGQQPPYTTGGTGTCDATACAAGASLSRSECTTDTNVCCEC